MGRERKRVKKKREESSEISYRRRSERSYIRCNFEQGGASADVDLFRTRLDSSKFFRCDWGMKRTQQDRRQLGMDIVAMRRRAGYRTISELAATDIGISSKTIGKVERGEIVSEGTIADLRRFLDDATEPNARYPPPRAAELAHIPSQELLDEISRRLMRQERDHAGPPITPAGDDPAATPLVTDEEDSTVRIVEPRRPPQPDGQGKSPPG